MTNSALLLGLVSFTATLPSIVLALFGGVIADRFNRRFLLIGSQTVFLCTASLLGILTTLHLITVWLIILMALINGAFNTVGWPAWQAFIGDLVPQEQLSRGVALNSMQFNLSRVIGPALGGLSVGLLGIAGSYYLNAISYVAVIIPLLIIRPMRARQAAPQQGMWRGLVEGVSYTLRRPALQKVLLLQFMIAFLVFPYIVLLPLFARDIFHIGATGLGVLNAAAGIGAMVGAGLLVALGARLNRGGHFLLTLCVVGGFVGIAFALARNLDASLLILVLLGVCTVMATTVSNTTLQIMTPEEMRGRMLSIWMMISLGLAPFGNLLAGWVAQSIGASLTLSAGGGLCIVTSLLVVIIYRERNYSSGQQSITGESPAIIRR